MCKQQQSHALSAKKSTPQTQTHECTRTHGQIMTQRDTAGRQPRREGRREGQHSIPHTSQLDSIEAAEVR